MNAEIYSKLRKKRDIILKRSASYQPSKSPVSSSEEIITSKTRTVSYKPEYIDNKNASKIKSSTVINTPATTNIKAPNKKPSIGQRFKSFREKVFKDKKQQKTNNANKKTCCSCLNKKKTPSHIKNTSSTKKPGICSSLKCKNCCKSKKTQSSSNLNRSKSPNSIRTKAPPNEKKENICSKLKCCKSKNCCKTNKTRSSSNLNRSKSPNEKKGNICSNFKCCKCCKSKKETQNSTKLKSTPSLKREESVGSRVSRRGFNYDINSNNTDEKYLKPVRVPRKGFDYDSESLNDSVLSKRSDNSGFEYEKSDESLRKKSLNKNGFDNDDDNLKKSNSSRKSKDFNNNVYSSKSNISNESKYSKNGFDYERSGSLKSKPLNRKGFDYEGDSFKSDKGYSSLSRKSKSTYGDENKSYVKSRYSVNLNNSTEKISRRGFDYDRDINPEIRVQTIESKGYKYSYENF